MGLFGDDPVAPKPKRKPASKSDGATQRLMDIYKAEHESRFGCQPLLGASYAYAMRIFKDLKDQLGEEPAAAVVRAFVSNPDPLVRNYTVKDLNFHAPRLHRELNGNAAARRGELDAVTAHNIAQAQRAISGRLGGKKR